MRSMSVNRCAPAHRAHPIDVGRELGHERLDIEPVRGRSVVLERDERLRQQVFGAPHAIAAETQVESARELYESFQETAVGDRGRVPRRLPQLLRLEVAAPVEDAGALRDDRRHIGNAHAGSRPSFACSSSCSRFDSPRAARSTASPASSRRTASRSARDKEVASSR